jgi:hypothetical protein
MKNSPAMILDEIHVLLAACGHSFSGMQDKAMILGLLDTPIAIDFSYCQSIFPGIFRILYCFPMLVTIS